MQYQYIDTHAHLNILAFSKDADAVASQCQEEGVAVVNVGTTLSTSKRAVDLAEKHTNCYAIVGLHPIQSVQADPDEPAAEAAEVFSSASYTELLKESGKIIGVGECGFDYWHCPKDSYEIQEQAFIAQIQFANEHNLPLMIHTRGPKPNEVSPTGRSVYQDVYELLKQYAKVPFTVHFYAGTVEEAKHFFDLGGYISFTGVVTFANEYAEVIKNSPLDRIHAETDCPFVAPVPHRGKRAEPWMVQSVVSKIAELKDLPLEAVKEQLRQNFSNLYFK